MYFLIENFKTKKPNIKLDHVKIGPFLFKKIKKSFDYELNLPNNVKIFPMFNIFLFESNNSKTLLATIIRYHIKKMNTKSNFFLRQNGQR